MTQAHLQTCGAADVATWDKMIALNLIVPMRLTRALAPSLAQRQGGGYIINISSMAGLRASKYNSAYSASKWGLTGWSRNSFEVSVHLLFKIASGFSHNLLAGPCTSMEGCCGYAPI